MVSSFSLFVFKTFSLLFWKIFSLVILGFLFFFFSFHTLWFSPLEIEFGFYIFLVSIHFAFWTKKYNHRNCLICSSACFIAYVSLGQFQLVNIFFISDHNFLILCTHCKFLLKGRLWVLPCWILDVFLLLQIFLAFVLGSSKVTCNQYDYVKPCFKYFFR